MTTESIRELKAFYRTGEEIVVSSVPSGTVRVVARRASGAVVEASLSPDARFGELPGGTYSVEALDSGGAVLAEELTTVGAHQGERPVHGFATSFHDDDVEPVLDWHRALRTTVVQVYDWMASYTEPLGALSGWQDPSHRPVSFEALRNLAAGLRASGAITHAYAPIYAVGNDFAAAHPEMLMYRGDGQAVRFLDQIVLADPGNEAWQRHFVAAYGSAADAVGFDGFHIDTYGYPRAACDADGRDIDMRAAYESFLKFVRAARPADLISFNQVNGVPSAARLPGGSGFRYCEVWPPNTEWRHLEGLLDRSSGRAGLLAAPSPRDAVVRGSLACYPPVWGIDQPGGPISESARPAALRTVVSTEAIATMLGTSALIYGDRTAALCDPYYPKHVRLTSGEATTVLAWRRFALRCRDLFLEGEDTSWYEIDDENGSVGVEVLAADGAVGSEVPVRPEPTGGSVFCRVVHSDRAIAVGVLDLSGSAHGRWSEPTEAGSVSSVRVRVLLNRPESWRADALVLGAHGGHFVEASARTVAHRQGHALEVELPLVAGWSVLRVSADH